MAVDTDEYGELVFEHVSVTKALTDAEYDLHLLLAEQRERKKDKK